MERRDLAYAAGVGVAAAVAVQMIRRARRRLAERAATGGWRPSRFLRPLVASGAHAPLAGGPSHDAVLRDRVLAAVHRVAPTAALDVSVFDGQVTLSGPIDRAGTEKVLRGASAVPGVLGVENALDVIDAGAPAPPRRRGWSPAARVAVGAAGSTLCALALRRFGLLGAPVAAIGVGALSRAVANRNLRRLYGIHLGARRIEFFASRRIRLPADTAHRFWSHFENLPAFFHHLAEVRSTGHNEWRWTLKQGDGRGPTWRTWMTETVPGKLIAWESAPGAEILSSGVANFEDLGDGVTHLSVRMAYGTSAGVPTLPFRAIFGRQAVRRFREDLGRLATYLETSQLGRRTAHP